MLSLHNLSAAGRLHDITFDAPPGQLVGVIGANGSGKSSLLKAVAGLLAHDGKVTIHDQDVSSLPAHERAPLLGYLAQERRIPWGLTGIETVQLGRTQPIAHDDLQAVLRDVDAAGFSHRTLDQLSGGERARLLLARLLVSPALLWLLDEPLAALDIRHQIQVMQLLARIAHKGRTIIIALHDLALAVRYCDRLLVMRDCRLIADGAAATLLDEALLREAFGLRGHVTSGLDIVLDENLPDKA